MNRSSRPGDVIHRTHRNGRRTARTSAPAGTRQTVSTVPSSEHTRGPNTSSIAIDIGESVPFEMSIGGLLDVRYMSETPNSACLKLTYIDPDEETEVLLTKWARSLQEANSRDQLVIMLARDTVTTPIYRLKEVFSCGSKFVYVGIRSYVSGTTLSECLQHLDREQV